MCSIIRTFINIVNSAYFRFNHVDNISCVIYLLTDLSSIDFNGAGDEKIIEFAEHTFFPWFDLQQKMEGTKIKVGTLPFPREMEANTTGRIFIFF